ncbi:MAG: hypothetical protein ACR2RE_08675 [Geminicoccaceae bacterium]
MSEENEGQQGDGEGEISFPDNWKEAVEEGVRGHESLASINSVPDLAKSFVHAQKLIRADKAGQTVVLPGESATDEDRNAFYSAIGRPVEAKDYQIEVPEGLQRNEKFEGGFREAAHKAGLSNAQVKELSGFWHEHLAGQVKEAGEASEAQASDNEGALKTKWGNATEQNIELARRAARSFDIDGETLDSLQSKVGYVKTMEVFQKLGELTGKEDDTATERRGGFGPMTPDAAKNAIDAKLRDPDFLKAYQTRAHPDHKRAVEEMGRLQQQRAAA